MEKTAVCKYCKTQPVTEGICCAKCLSEVLRDMLERDFIAAYKEGVITREDYLFFFGTTTAPLTGAEEKRLNQIMRKVDDWLYGGFLCNGCGEWIEENDQGFAIIFVDKLSNKLVHGLTFVHKSDRCKQLVVGDSWGNWSDSCEPRYISLEQFLEYNEAGHNDLMPSEDKTKLLS